MCCSKIIRSNSRSEYFAVIKIENKLFETRLVEMKLFWVKKKTEMKLQFYISGKNFPFFSYIVFKIKMILYSFNKFDICTLINLVFL